MWRKKPLRSPIADFTAALGVEIGGIESRDLIDAALFTPDSVPESFHAFADAGDRSKTGNDSTTFHFVPTKHTKYTKVGKEKSKFILLFRLFRVFSGQS